MQSAWRSAACTYLCLHAGYFIIGEKKLLYESWKGWICRENEAKEIIVITIETLTSLNYPCGKACQQFSVRSTGRELSLSSLCLG